MPRMGLTPDKVVAAAATLADRVGIHGLSLSPLAAELGVRVPSLYKHIGGLDDLRRRLAARGAVGLAAAVDTAAGSRHGRDALLAIGAAYRGYASANRGCYQAMACQPAAYERCAGAVDALLCRAALEHGIPASGAQRAAQAVRSALHGFVALEAVGGLGSAANDASFDVLMTLLERGLVPEPQPGTRELRLAALGLPER